MPGGDGIFGNPFKLQIDTLGNRAEAVQQFQSYFYGRLAKEPEYEAMHDHGLSVPTPRSGCEADRSVERCEESTPVLFANDDCRSV